MIGVFSDIRSLSFSQTGQLDLQTGLLEALTGLLLSNNC
jgi:hypothetical protein